VDYGLSFAEIGGSAACPQTVLVGKVAVADCITANPEFTVYFRNVLCRLILKFLSTVRQSNHICFLIITRKGAIAMHFNSRPPDVTPAKQIKQFCNIRGPIRTHVFRFLIRCLFSTRAAQMLVASKIDARFPTC